MVLSEKEKKKQFRGLFTIPLTSAPVGLGFCMSTTTQRGLQLTHHRLLSVTRCLSEHPVPPTQMLSLLQVMLWDGTFSQLVWKMHEANLALIDGFLFDLSKAAPVLWQL